MLFYIKDVLGSENVNNVFVGSIEEGKAIDIKKILSLSIPPNNVSLTCNNSFEKPYLILDRYQEIGTNVTQLVQIYNRHKVTELSDDEKSKVAQAINSSIEFLENLLSLLDEYFSYKNGDLVKINIRNQFFFGDFGQISEMINKINNSGKAVTHYIKDNKTLYRKKPGDKLFIEIPTLDKLENSFSLGITETINIGSIAHPYGIPKSEKDPAYQINTPAYSKYLSSINFPLEFIKGNVDKNTLEIQDFEMDYKEALHGLCEEAVSRHIDSLSSGYANVSLLALKSYLKELCYGGLRMNWGHTGYMATFYEPYVSDDYDDGEFDDSNSSSGNKGEDDSKLEVGISFLVDDSMDDIQLNEFVQDKVSGEYTSLISSLFDEMLDNAIEKGRGNIDKVKEELLKAFDLIIDIIIKVYRFGYLKPERIFLFEKDGEPRYLLLNQSRISSSTGCKDPNTVVTDDSGRSLFVDSVILENGFMLPDKFRNLGFKTTLIDTPLGLVCKRYYDKDEQTVYISFFDLCRIYIDNDEEEKISGIDLVDGKFILSDEVKEILSKDSISELYNNITSLGKVISSVNNDSMSDYIYYRSSKFEECYFKMEEDNPRKSLLSLLYTVPSTFLPTYEQFIIGDIYDTEEIRMIVKQYKVPASLILDINMFLSICPIFAEVSDLLKTRISDIETVFNIYYDCMKSYISFSDNKENKSDFSKSNNFNDLEIEMEEEDNMTNIQSLLFKNDLDGYKFFRVELSDNQVSILESNNIKIYSYEGVINNNKFTSKIIGYIAVNPSDDSAPKVFVEPTEPVTVSPGGKLSLARLLPAIFSILVDLGSNKQSKVMFKDLKTLTYYSKVLRFLV